MSGEPILNLVGNLTADPELRVTATGDSVAAFTVACTPRILDRSGGSRLVNPGLVGPLQKINSTAILKKPAIEFAVVADVASNNQKCLPADDARNIPQTHPAAEAPNPDRAE